MMMTGATKAVELQRRLIGFAAKIVRLYSKLHGSVEGRHIAGQMLRSATATAANYGEARGAESRADFLHKLRVVLKVKKNEGQEPLIPERRFPAPQPKEG